MKRPISMLGAALVAGAALGAGGAWAQQVEQYVPLLTYRTGPYAPSGIPAANGMVDYFKLVNLRGGVNGVRLLVEECETGYDTARSVECYERMKTKNGGAVLIQPWSTGATFAISEKADADKIPVLTLGYGRGDAANGKVFKWVFPLAGNYQLGEDVIVQAIGAREGGLDKLAGKKIAVAYHDSAYGKETLPLLRKRAAMHGFQLIEVPLTPPGLEQKSAWLQIRRDRPDYIILRGYGVMTPTALKEAQSIGFARNRIYGSWWAGSEADTRDLGDNAKGYNAVALQGSANYDAKVIKDILAQLYDKRQGTAGNRDEVGEVLYVRGLMAALFTVEAIRTAQEHFKKAGQRVTGEEVRWALENLNITQQRIDELGFNAILRPIRTSCADHMGSYVARISTWDGKRWGISSDWMEANRALVDEVDNESSARYAKEHNITPRTCNE
ncbi:MAG: ABC transporter permease [Lautropia sp.]|nr:MAG: ABC transporter permease [Pseudomonadota bacterium]MBC6959997.1 ABC transporter permease [Lautropia sp.]MCL4701905.1 ABC transporter substrate-binding protein [Burkholderiaceae bacterium]MCZ2412779.1 ABC transporter substrate-binding protein [Burkholderiales bacterium]MDL1907515.1 ABC transporter permease [Betaproteobacteria bacterium PRO1]